MRLAALPLVLLLVAGPALGLAGQGAGTDTVDLVAEARAARDAPPGAGAVVVGWPNAGDEGRFERTASDADPRNVTFAWRAERIVDAWGREVAGAKVAYQGAGASGCTFDLITPAGNATTTTTELDRFARYAGDARPVASVRPFSCTAGVLAGDEGLTVGSQGTMQLTYGEWPETLCLFRFALQGVRVETGAMLPPACAPWGADGWFAGAPARRHGFEALPVYHLSADGAAATRMWLVDGLAYPLEVERQLMEDGETRTRRLVLVALATSGPPLASGPEAPPPSFDLRAPDRLLGPADAGARLPLRLSDAARAATGDLTLRGLQGLLADPQAVLAGAALCATQPAGTPAPVPEWALVYAAPGRAAVAVECVGGAAPMAALARCREVGVESVDARIGAVPSDFGASDLPPRMASFAEALARWEAMDPDAAASPVLQALYRPWGDEDTTPALQIGTRADARPEATRSAAASRGESLASLDPASARTTDAIASFVAPLRVSDLPAGIPASAILAPGGPQTPAPLAVSAPLLVAAGIVTAGALAAVLILMGMALYTRLVRAKVLDSDARARIHALVAEDPGIHAAAILERLGRGNGLGEYHLSVLVREGYLACVETKGFRHYFVAGRLPHAEMRVRAVLREGHAARLFGLIRDDPGVQVGALAERAGLSLPHVSRTVKRLAEAGLVEPTKVGRIVRLRVAEGAPWGGGPVPAES